MWAIYVMLCLNSNCEVITVTPQRFETKQEYENFKDKIDPKDAGYILAFPGASIECKLINNG